MLSTILVSVFLFGLMMALMAIGVMVQGKRLAGSCGGNPGSVVCGCAPKKQIACRVKFAEAAGNSEARITAE